MQVQKEEREHPPDLREPHTARAGGRRTSQSEAHTDPRPPARSHREARGGGQGGPARQEGPPQASAASRKLSGQRGHSDKWQPRRHEEQECSHVLALESTRAVSGNGSQEAEDTVPELGWFQQLPCTPRGETSSERVRRGSSSSSRSHRNGRVQSQRWVVRQRMGTWESPQ